MGLIGRQILGQTDKASTRPENNGKVCYKNVLIMDLDIRIWIQSFYNGVLFGVRQLIDASVGESTDHKIPQLGHQIPHRPLSFQSSGPPPPLPYEICPQSHPPPTKRNFQELMVKFVLKYASGRSEDHKRSQDRTLPATGYLYRQRKSRRQEDFVGRTLPRTVGLNLLSALIDTSTGRSIDHRTPQQVTKLMKYLYMRRESHKEGKRKAKEEAQERWMANCLQIEGLINEIDGVPYCPFVCPESIWEKYDMEKHEPECSAIDSWGTYKVCPEVTPDSPQGGRPTTEHDAVSTKTDWVKPSTVLCPSSIRSAL
ncbi:hypothetical protein M9H77_22185 [Catharanthus roseus]|uniref:Uncharacterized protein n=1 Tax=Catharanthus roseus TaxID=4058 RepID=A0ACC0APD6_CATRO|nr:hypothetical protein M9H77_22185 [Catharanthus roseus]